VTTWPRKPGAAFADAPVPGSKDPAGPGQLLILASGPAVAADTVGPVSGIIRRKTVRLGEAGRGSQVKLVVNAYMSVLIEGAAETMALADRLGIGHPQLAGVIGDGPPDAPIADAERTSAPPPWPCVSRALTSEKAKDQTQIWPSGAKPMRPAQIRRP